MLVIALMFSHRFRWVFCQLEVLRQCFPSSVRCVLAELPESLDETYERILQQIPKSNREHAHRLLQCLTVAMRPLRVDELAEVLAINFSAPGGTPLVDEKLRWEDKERAVLSACSSLVAIVQDGYSCRVQFSHFSVKEFLTSDRLAASMVDTLHYHHIHLRSAHTIMAQACLSVLLRLDYGMVKETIESYPMARYAGKHFGDHVEFEGVLPLVTEGVDNLLDPDKPHFPRWAWLRINDWNPWAWHNSDMDPEVFLNIPPTSSPFSFPQCPPWVSPLYYVAAFGHFSLSHRLILKYPHHLYVTDDKGCTPLHIAVLAGKVEVSKLLIEHSVNLDISDAEDWTLLHMAAYMGQFEVSRILLERHDATKAWLNMRNKKGRTPLHLASRRHHSDIVALLLKFGADIKAQDNDSMTTLHLAVRGPAAWADWVDDVRSSEIARLLLEHGASVHVRDKNNQTPLHLASLRQSSSTMALLLKFGADVDSQDDDYMTPLLFASQLLRPEWYETRYNRSENVQLLLDRGASVHVQNKKGQTALHIASQSHLSQIVALLLKLGVDVDAKDNDNMTPLQLVVTESRGYMDDYNDARRMTAQVLLDHGAKVHTRNKNGQTPLHLTSLHLSSSIMALLLKFGADVDAMDNDNLTPLQLLMLTGPMNFPAYDDVRRSSAAQVLLEHGASVHAKNKNGQAPLHLASLYQFSSTAALLLEFGADVDVRDNDNMTPLLLTLAGEIGSSTRDDGINPTVQLLLAHGANFNVRNKNGQTPLHLASQRYFSTSLGLLLSSGADVDAQDDNNMTPLHFAISLQPLWHFWDDGGPKPDEDAKVEIIQLFLKHGANIQVQDNKGETPFQVAAARGEQKVIELLSEYLQNDHRIS